MDHPRKKPHSRRSPDGGVDVVFQIPVIEGGGAERKTVLLASELARRGHQILLLTTGEPGHEEYHLHESVQRVCIPNFLDKRNLPERMIAFVRRLRWARRFYCEHQPKVIVSVGSSSFLSVSLAMPAASRHINWLTSTLHVRNSPKERLIRRIGRPKCDVVVSQTQDIAREAENRGFRNVVCIANPIVVPDVIALRESKMNNLKLVSVGRMVWEKNYRLLLFALEALKSMPEQWCFTFVGTGGLKNELETLRDELGLRGRVHFVGWVNDVRAILRDSDIFVMSSSHEGQPNALLEAMAEGLACISTDFAGGGARELLAPTNAGVLVPSDDAEALERAMRQLIGDPKLREELALRAQDVVKNQAVSRIADRWEELFKEQQSS